MKKTIIILSFIVCNIVSGQSTWKADNSHSKVGLSITHLMISEVEGHFGEFDISATADDKFTDPKFTVVIKTASIDTDNDNRDKHLRSADFFDTDKYQTIIFATTGFEKTGENIFNLKGDLTMHGITKPVLLNGKLNGIITDQRSQKLKAGIKLTGKINRLDYGIGGDTPTLGNEVNININLEMAQQ
tara:strand:+ start:63 stop:623 length:561 start_codon:yes stop_codon:yes gene_type:complete